MNRWKIATVALAVVAATGWTMTPASSHVAGWAHNWSQHIKPRADKRYYTKTASDARYVSNVLAPGKTISGTWATSAPSGNYGMVTVDFRGRMAGAVTPVYASTTSTSCPGVGQAAPGVLCFYPAFNFSMAFSNFYQPDTTSPGANAKGTVAYFTSSAANGNVWGTWTAKRALPSTRVPAYRAPAPRVGTPR